MKVMTFLENWEIFCGSVENSGRNPKTQPPKLFPSPFDAMKFIKKLILLKYDKLFVGLRPILLHILKRPVKNNWQRTICIIK